MLYRQNFKLSFLSLFALIVLLPAAGIGQTVVRGPYLQMATPTSIIVRWRTDVASDSVVTYAAADAAALSQTEIALVTDHEVELTGLAPDTLYNYTIGSSGQMFAGGDLSSGGDGEHFFTTPPVTGTDKPTRIWVIGDSGTADANAAAVRDAYKSFTGNRATDVWLMLGDNAYNSGTDSEYQAAMFDQYPELLRQVPVWSALGNHDGVDMFFNPPGAYPQIFSFPVAGEAGGVASNSENYYSFDYGDIHFISLDSTTASNIAAGSAMWTWLAADLAANEQRWTIAFWHHPHYSKGSHDSDVESGLIKMRENALPLLEQYGADLVLTGHSHSYERSVLIDGHYGTSDTLTPAMLLDDGSGNFYGDGAYVKPGQPGTAHEGAVHVVVGSSGKTEIGGSMDHPVMHSSLLTLGSLVLDVSAERLDAAFVDSTGAVLDEFTLIKTPPRVVSIDVDPWSSANEILPAAGYPVPVAVLGESVAGGDAADLDVNQIDPSSVKLGIGAAPNMAVPWVTDFDNDADLDVLFAFRGDETGIFCGDTEVSLEGKLLTGEAFRGSDTITTVECADTGCHP